MQPPDEPEAGRASDGRDPLERADTGVAISVVMPLYQGEPYLERVLPPLRDALRRGEIVEVLVVDDGSTDEGPRLCAEAGFRVVEGRRRRGPAAARNDGARVARGDVLLFVDADVVLHGDAIRTVARVLMDQPDLAAVFGSYDDQPAAPGWVSRYRNLLHHYVHQIGDPEAGTFWAGCGAVRRSVFEELGGFDATRFAAASIEDIELGMRMRRQGHRILLCKELLSTHLKRWTPIGMIVTDVTKRALPWSRLLLETGSESQELNLSEAERGRALLACAFWGSLPFALLHPGFAAASAALLVASWTASRAFYRLVLARAGAGPFAAALVFHQLYYLYSAVAYGYCVAERALGRTPGPRRNPPESRISPVDPLGEPDRTSKS